MSKDKVDYVDLIYGNENPRTPKTEYPDKLINYLIKAYGIGENLKVLDVGCGRGDFLNAFIEAGLEGYGVDYSDAAVEHCPNATIRKADLENDEIPFKNDMFDVVFSKSVLEHFHNPEVPVGEMYRVLKPGGLIISMVPSWEYCWDIYFEDYTHRTPFMLSAFRDLHILQGFSDVDTKIFTQLPATWNDPSRVWTLLSNLTRILAPSVLRYRYKWVRFSKEIMLICTATKRNKI